MRHATRRFPGITTPLHSAMQPRTAVVAHLQVPRATAPDDYANVASIPGEEIASRINLAAMHMGMSQGQAMSRENEAERAAKMLARRYGDLAPAVLEDLLNAVPHENAELLSLLRRILVAVQQQSSRPN